MPPSSPKMSKKGRRPPFYAFGDERDDDLDSCDLVEIELGNFASLRLFEQSLSNHAKLAWFCERERIHKAFLSEAAFARRRRDRAYVLRVLARVGGLVHNPEAMTQIVKAWMLMLTMVNLKCQKEDWKKPQSEGRCGVPLSLAEKIPAVKAQARPPTQSHSARMMILDALKDRLTCVWLTQIPCHFGKFTGPALDVADGATQEARIRSDVRNCSVRALAHNDRLAIDLLAFVMIYRPTAEIEALQSAFLGTGKRQALSLTTAPTPNPPHKLFEADFRKLFMLEDKQAWANALARGKVEVAKAENASFRTYLDGKQYVSPSRW
ncbi:hypothetical protein JCM10212_003343 [Sporobolomyces blumeae]